MISRSKLALRAALSAGLSLFAATPAQANAATAVSIPGRMYSVGCMSASSCVTAGFSSGQGLPTEIDIVHGRTVVRTVRPKGTSSGNLTDVTCPSRAECIVVAPGAPGRTDIVTVSSAAAVTIRTVTAAAGTTYDSISCLTARSCELSGWSTDNSPIVVASWNGRRITATPTGPREVVSERRSLHKRSCRVGTNGASPPPRIGVAHIGKRVPARTGRETCSSPRVCSECLLPRCKHSRTKWAAFAQPVTR